MILETWSTILTKSFQGIWLGFANFVPDLIIAIIIFIIGWIVGSLVGKLVAQILSSLKIDQALKSAGFDEVVKRAGHDLDTGAFLGGLVKWFIIIVFLVASVDALGLTDVNLFLRDVLGYLPRVIVAVLVLLLAVVIADVMRKIVVASAKAAHIQSANFLGAVTKWSIWIFAVLTALVELNIAVSFINTLFTGVVVAISLAVGLAFGLGGQDAAAKSIENFKDEIAHHKV